MNPIPSSPRITRLTSNGKTTTGTVSPDGKFVAYVIDEERRQSLWLKNIPTGSDVQILPANEKTNIGPVTFSPDGNHIYYGSSGPQSAIFQLPVLGGTPKRILNHYAGPISFSPNGNQFAFIRESGTGEETASIVIVNSDGGNERIIATSKRPAIFLRSASWSPDGTIIACAALNPSGKQEVVAVRVADGVVSAVPSPRWIVIWEIVWRSDGKSFLVVAAENNSSNQIWSLAFPSGEARRITHDSNDYRSISLSRDPFAIVAVREQQEAQRRRDRHHERRGVRGLLEELSTRIQRTCSFLPLGCFLFTSPRARLSRKGGARVKRTGT